MRKKRWAIVASHLQDFLPQKPATMHDSGLSFCGTLLHARLLVEKIVNKLDSQLRTCTWNQRFDSPFMTDNTYPLHHPLPPFQLKLQDLNAWKACATTRGAKKVRSNKVGHYARRSISEPGFVFGNGFQCLQRRELLLGPTSVQQTYHSTSSPNKPTKGGFC